MPQSRTAENNWEKTAIMEVKKKRMPLIMGRMKTMQELAVVSSQEAAFLAPYPGAADSDLACLGRTRTGAFGCAFRSCRRLSGCFGSFGFKRCGTGCGRRRAFLKRFVLSDGNACNSRCYHRRLYDNDSSGAAFGMALLPAYFKGISSLLPGHC